MAKSKASKTPNTDRQIASGDWNPLWDMVRKWDPEFMEGYFAFRSVPHRKGPLPKKVKEFILIAVNAATTHLYAPGTRRHIQNALRHGATKEELFEVIQLVSILGIHSINMAVPILAEELEKQAKGKRGK
jgi:alkylhydroperoxidase/carboxymuconolactone decarboxylase family protein YurZ